MKLVMKVVYVGAVLLLLFLTVVNIKPCKGGRVLEANSEKEWWKKKEMLQSLQKGQVPASGSSGCTFIPESGGSGGCPLLKEKHFAGRVRVRFRARGARVHRVMPISLSTTS